jgi:predicted molibdopterin-dependent oxidoreductase YjgC
MMGVCFECQVEIDGIRGQQACLVVVRDGMTVRRGRM